MARGPPNHVPTAPVPPQTTASKYAVVIPIDFAVCTAMISIRCTGGTISPYIHTDRPAVSASRTLSLYPMPLAAPSPCPPLCMRHMALDLPPWPHHLLGRSFFLDGPCHHHLSVQYMRTVCSAHFVVFAMHGRRDRSGGIRGMPQGGNSTAKL